MQQRLKMSFSPQQNNDYSSFGFLPEKDEEHSAVDYSEFGFSPEAKDVLPTEEPKKEKAGKAKSVLYGFIEAALGIPALAQYGVNEISRPLEELAYGKEEKEPSFEEENPLMSYLGSLPESVDEVSRRLRTGTAGVTAGAIGGIPGILAGLVGSQAGQTVREVYGKEGKFENFGIGEAGAIAADVIGGLGTGIGSAVAKSGKTAASNAARAPSIFRPVESRLEKATVKHVLQGEKNALQQVVDGFSTSQINQFESDVAALAPQRYTELSNAPVSGIQRQSENMHRNGMLSMISPLEVTPEQGGRAIQQAANEVFQQEVIEAERAVYSAAKESAESVSGSAPKTLADAKKLRDSLVSTSPSNEQNPVIGYLNNLISDLEVVTPASVKPASKLVGVNGLPLTAAEEIAESSAPAVKKANELVDMVQKGNQAINYGSELREQSHRLKPILNTLREETGQVLSKKPEAASLYQEANTLHARNAETWGTKYMRNVRFSENPEDIISKTTKASNLRNLKQAIPNQDMQDVAERLVVDKITKGGKSSSNARAITDISPELSPNAKNAADEIINTKDALTTQGGRAAVRNEILKDAAKSVSTGKRPEKVLDLMQTPKGYGIVRETLNQSPEGRQIMQSFERLFMEDIVVSIQDSSGRIDFKKAQNIFKNKDVRQVAEMIGGEGIVHRFEQLQTAASNFEKNSALYSNPETQSFLKSVMSNVKDAGFAATLLHAMHVPWPVIVGLGLGKASLGVGKLGYKALEKRVLSNPNAINTLERVSRVTTKEELANQLPRLFSEIDKKETKKK